MPESFEVYCDQFQITLGPYGCTLNFMLTSPTPPSPGSPAQAERLGTVRMSVEHLKVMTFMLRRQVLEYERNMGVQAQLPVEVLNSLRISQEDWNGLWGH